MSPSVLNFGILLLGAFFGIKETIQLSTGKRITKITSQILIHLLIVIFIASILIDNILIITLISISLALLYGLIRYYFGAKFKVQTKDMNKLQMLVGEGVTKVYGSSYEITSEDNLTEFKIEGNKVILIKEKEGLTDRAKEYHLVFKRWNYYETKGEILDYISDGLMDEEYEVSKIKEIIKIVAFAAFMFILALINANIIMEQDFSVREVITDDFPKEVYIPSRDEYYRDKETIDELYTILSRGYGFKTKDIPKDHSLNQSLGIIEFPVSRRILYIDKDAIYLFVHDSEIGNRSVINYIAWQLHKLYDKKDGVYYKISLPNKETMEIKNLLFNIDSN